MAINQPDTGGLVVTFIFSSFFYAFFFMFFAIFGIAIVSVLKKALKERKDLHPYFSAGIEFISGSFGFLGFGHIFLDRKRRGILLLVGFFMFHIIISIMYLYFHSTKLIYNSTEIAGIVTITRLLIVIMSAYWAYKTAKGKKLGFEWRREPPKKEGIPDLGIIKY